MLIITRYNKQRIYFGDGSIVLTLVAAREGLAELCIETPENLKVWIDGDAIQNFRNKIVRCANKESVYVGEGIIKVTPLNIRKGFSSIGVLAPKNTPIWREELICKLQYRQRLAMQYNHSDEYWEELYKKVISSGQYEGNSIKENIWEIK